MDAASFNHGCVGLLCPNQTVPVWSEEEQTTRQSLSLVIFPFLLTEPDANGAQPLFLNQPSFCSFLLSSCATGHGSPVGAVSVHANGVRCHPHGCGGGEPQSVHLWAHHPAYVSGAALQLHLHAQHTKPLRPANRCSRHGGTVHCKRREMLCPCSSY